MDSTKKKKDRWWSRSRKNSDKSNDDNHTVSDSGSDDNDCSSGASLAATDSEESECDGSTKQEVNITENPTCDTSNQQTMAEGAAAACDPAEDPKKSDQTQREKFAMYHQRRLKKISLEKKTVVKEKMDSKSQSVREVKSADLDMEKLNTKDLKDNLKRLSDQLESAEEKVASMESKISVSKMEKNEAKKIIDSQDEELLELRQCLKTEERKTAECLARKNTDQEEICILKDQLKEAEKKLEDCDEVKQTVSKQDKELLELRQLLKIEEHKTAKYLARKNTDEEEIRSLHTEVEKAVLKLEKVEDEARKYEDEARNIIGKLDEELSEMRENIEINQCKAAEYEDEIRSLQVHLERKELKLEKVEDETTKYGDEARLARDVIDKLEKELAELRHYRYVDKTREYVDRKSTDEDQICSLQDELEEAEKKIKEKETEAQILSEEKRELADQVELLTYVKEELHNENQNQLQENKDLYERLKQLEVAFEDKLAEYVSRIEELTEQTPSSNNEELSMDNLTDVSQSDGAIAETGNSANILILKEKIQGQQNLIRHLSVQVEKIELKRIYEFLPSPNYVDIHVDDELSARERAHRDLKAYFIARKCSDEKHIDELNKFIDDLEERVDSNEKRNQERGNKVDRDKERDKRIELQTQVLELQSKLGDMEDELMTKSDLEYEVDKAKTEKASMEDVNSSLVENIEDLEKMIHDLKVDKDKLKEAEKYLRNEVAEIQESFDDAVDNIDQLVHDQTIKAGEIEEKESQISSLTAEVAELKSIIEDMELDKDELKQAAGELKKEIENLKESLNEETERNKQLAQQHSSTRNEMNGLKRSNEDLRQRVAVMNEENDKDQISELQRQVKEKDSEKELLTKQIEELTRVMEELEVDKEKRQVEEYEMKCELEDLTDNLDEAKEKFEELMEEHEEKEKVKNEMERTIQEKNFEIANLNGEIKSLKNFNDDMRREVDEVKSKAIKANQGLSQETSKSNAAVLIKAADSLTENINDILAPSLTEIILEATSPITRKLKEKEEIISDMEKRIQSEIAGKESLVESLTSANEHLVNQKKILDEKFDRMAKKIKGLEGEIERYSKSSKIEEEREFEMEELVSLKRTQEEEIKRLIEEHDQEIQMSAEKIKSLEQKITNLKEGFDDVMHHQEKEHVRTVSELKGCKKELEIMQNKCVKSNEELNALNERVKEMEKNSQQLEEELDAQKRKAESSEALFKEQDQVKDTELDTLKIRVSELTLSNDALSSKIHASEKAYIEMVRELETIEEKFLIKEEECSQLQFEITSLRDHYDEKMKITSKHTNENISLKAAELHSQEAARKICPKACEEKPTQASQEVEDMEVCCQPEQLKQAADQLQEYVIELEGNKLDMEEKIDDLVKELDQSDIQKVSALKDGREMATNEYTNTVDKGAKSEELLEAVEKSTNTDKIDTVEVGTITVESSKTVKMSEMTEKTKEGIVPNQTETTHEGVDEETHGLYLEQAANQLHDGVVQLERERENLHERINAFQIENREIQRSLDLATEFISKQTEELDTANEQLDSLNNLNKIELLQQLRDSIEIQNDLLSENETLVASRNKLLKMKGYSIVESHERIGRDQNSPAVKEDESSKQLFYSELKKGKDHSGKIGNTENSTQTPNGEADETTVKLLGNIKDLNRQIRDLGWMNDQNIREISVIKADKVRLQTLIEDVDTEKLIAADEMEKLENEIHKQKHLNEELETFYMTVIDETQTNVNEATVVNDKLAGELERVTSEREYLQSQVEDNMAHNQHLLSENKRLQRTLRELREAEVTDRVARKANAEQDKTQKLENEDIQKSLTRRIEQLEAELEDFTSKKEELAKKSQIIRRLEAEVADKDENIIELLNEKQEDCKKIEDAEAALVQSEQDKFKELWDLENRLRDTQRQLQIKTEELAETVKVSDNFEADITIKTEKIAQLKKSMAEERKNIKAALAQREMEIRNLREENLTITSDIRVKTNEELADKNTVLENEIKINEKLQIDARKWTRENEDLQKQIKNYRVKILQYEESIDKSQTDITDLMSSVHAKTNELEMIKTMRDNTEKKLQAKAVEILKVSKEKGAIETKLLEKIAENNLLQEDNQAIKRKLFVLNQDVDALRKSKDELRHDNANLRFEVDKLTADSQELTNELEKERTRKTQIEINMKSSLKTKNVEFQNLRAEMEENEVEMEAKYADYDILKEKNQTLMRKVSMLSHDLDTLRNSDKKINRENTKLIEDSEELSKEIDHLRNKHEGVVKKMNKLQKRNSDLTKKVENSKFLEEDAAFLRSRLAEAKEEVRYLQNNHKDADLEKYRSRCDSQAREIQDLKHKMMKLLEEKGEIIRLNKITIAKWERTLAEQKALRSNLGRVRQAAVGPPPYAFSDMHAVPCPDVPHGSRYPGDPELCYSPRYEDL